MNWRARLDSMRGCPDSELTKPTKALLSVLAVSPLALAQLEREVEAPAILKNDGGERVDPAQQSGRLLAMLRAEFLPESLLARDDAGPDGLAAMDAGELRTYALALHRSATMDAGTVPTDYTQAARCEGCGPVWLWATCPPVVKACPWCFRRKAGRGFPRPLVECGECGLGLTYRRGEPLRYPFARRECGEYRPALDSETKKTGS